jgi:hypothetical protein
MKIVSYIILCIPLPILCFAQTPDTLCTGTYGSTDYNFGYAVKETSDGGYILVGEYNNQFAYMVKVNSYGDTLWSKNSKYRRSILSKSQSINILQGFWSVKDHSENSDHWREFFEIPYVRKHKKSAFGTSGWINRNIYLYSTRFFSQV